MSPADLWSWAEENPGWLVAGLLFVLLVLRDALKKWITAGFEALGKLVYERFLGAMVTRHGLRKYRERILKRHSTFRVAFLGQREHRMDHVYVRLDTLGEKDGERQDAYAQVRASRNTVVVGPPGAGKSMLLKHSMLEWARTQERKRRGRAPGTIPVLLELRRCNAKTDPVELLAAQLKRDGFPLKPALVERLLGKGEITVLFDGLDEVASSERPEVARRLRDFAAQYDQCQTVVTCREAIYQGQLAPEFSATARVADFDDRQTQDFLHGWSGMADKGLEPLLSVLRRAPRLKGLVRNPLLATMFAFLYTDVYDGQSQQLPRSRAEFYRKAVDALLEQAKSSLEESLSSFPVQVKKEVLKKLALHAQDVSGERSDRLALPFREVIGVVKGMASDLNFPADQAKALLDEIVQRSGLLREVDGKERYQFAHLTLQEYLAAKALLEDEEGLLERYTRDPETWLETVRLWCAASERDSGPFIMRVAEKDELLAFECLADATLVNERVAEELEKRILALVREGPADLLEEIPALIRALGAVAADRRPRGRHYFDVLAGFVRDRDTASDPGRARLSCRVLAATNLPEAADFLVAEVRQEQDGKLGSFLRKQVVGMGDLAVPALREYLDKEWSIAVVQLFYEVGTPSAARSLVELLWEAKRLRGSPLDNGRLSRADDDGPRYAAAWYVGGLLGSETVQAEWSRMDVPAPEGKGFAEVLGPYSDQVSPQVQRVAAHAASWIAHGLKRVEEGSDRRSLAAARAVRIDPRLAVGLFVSDANGFHNERLRASHFTPSESTPGEVLSFLRRARNEQVHRSPHLPSGRGRGEILRLPSGRVRLAALPTPRVRGHLSDLLLDEVLRSLVDRKGARGVSEAQEALLRATEPRLALGLLTAASAGSAGTRSWTRYTELTERFEFYENTWRFRTLLLGVAGFAVLSGLAWWPGGTAAELGLPGFLRWVVWGLLLWMLLVTPPKVGVFGREVYLAWICSPWFGAKVYLHQPIRYDHWSDGVLTWVRVCLAVLFTPVVVVGLAGTLVPAFGWWASVSGVLLAGALLLVMPYAVAKWNESRRYSPLLRHVVVGDLTPGGGSSVVADSGR